MLMHDLESATARTVGVGLFAILRMSAKAVLTRSPIPDLEINHQHA
jgi:hypothetical protein